LDKHHSGHVSGHEVAVIRLRRCRSPLRRDEAVALQLIRKLLQRGRLEAGENQRRLDGLER
jgi:hypothetical protein